MMEIEKVYDDWGTWGELIEKSLNDEKAPVSLEGRLLYHMWMAIKKDVENMRK